MRLEKNRYVDTHTHLKHWSPDAQQTIEELLQAATEQQLSGVTITDHYDIESVTDTGQRWIFDPQAYEQQHRPFYRRPSQRKDGEPVGLLLGIEMSYLPQHLAQMRSLIQDPRLDCSILSLHEYQGIDPVLHPEKLFGKSLPQVYAGLIETMADMAQAIPQADVIGHYDFFSRYALAQAPKMLYRHAPKAFDRLFKTMIQNQQALEINTRTIVALHEERGYSLAEAMPDAELIKRYRQLGGTLVTLGSDAHCKQHVAHYFPQTAGWLAAQGVRYYTWFEAHKPHYAPLLEIE